MLLLARALDIEPLGVSAVRALDARAGAGNRTHSNHVDFLDRVINIWISTLFLLEDEHGLR